MKLAQVREFMNNLDDATVRRGVVPVCRRALEDKLDYLRTYACGIEPNDQRDEFKAICFLGSDSYSHCFGFVIKARPEEHVCSIDYRELQNGFETFSNRYSRTIINGGLIWSGAKTLAEFERNPSSTLKSDVWSTCT